MYTLNQYMSEINCSHVEANILDVELSSEESTFEATMKASHVILPLETSCAHSAL